ncbi:polyketide synthase [Lindgomyces ingoldianus]|uniref:Polyketide synthase n=1 Tax=Lindgomyces ingoldianus TaxID=673940 RepID=A0ACB6QNZ0_9PLEO|nr:polyketide synthase [Lindgomyces ingoldianus]KAF2468734.1 polyketide synthase [Lindgomyces ingoldianus]
MDHCNGFALSHRLVSSNPDALEPIAVIGLSCRLPGSAVNAQKLWELLESGGSAWSPFPKERFNDLGFRSADPANHKPGTTNTHGGHFLAGDIGAFDATLFGVHPMEASAMDPQQRLLMEIAYEAFENAGLTKDELWGSNTGVYVGQWTSDYHEMLARDTEFPPVYMTTGTGPAISSNRLSYHFNLKGPSFTLDTGCSASLVALHQAIQSLRSGETSRSFVAGVNLTLDPQRYTYQSRLKMFSNEGRSFPFDSRANGYGRGEGCSGVVLEPLSTALKRRAPIRAVIRNSVVNQDGRTPGISVPSSQAQLEAIRKGYTQIGLQINADYVEAHGTGTRIGDPIEAKAIAEAFSQRSPAEGFLPIGSIKGNIGHLESAAGLTAIIKAVLMLEKGIIPPQVNFQEANENIRLHDLRLRIPIQPEKSKLKRISVNSFGYGGTNAHVILDARSNEVNGTGPEETQELAYPPRIFVLSAATEISCKAMASNLLEYLESTVNGGSSDDLLNQLAYTLGCRSLFEYRSAAIAADIGELRKQLQEISETSPARQSLRSTPRIGFVFSGQGAQYYNMGREIFGLWPTFTESLTRAGQCLAHLGCSWDMAAELMRSEKESRVSEPEIAQSLSTAIQLALVDMMEELGVTPALVVGHSSGEIAAAYCAKLISFEDAMRASYHRGRLTSVLLGRTDYRPGAMMAVGAAPEVVEDVLRLVEGSSKRLRIACYNSPSNVTVSGDESLVDSLQKELEQRNLFNRKLRTGGAAYHSHQMLHIQQEYAESLDGLKGLEGTRSTTMISSLTGKEIDARDIDKDYWVRNLVSPVLFSTALRKMWTTQRGTSRIDIVQEIGAHTQLEGPIQQTSRTLQNSNKTTYVGTLKRGVRADFAILGALRTLFMAGVQVDLRLPNTGYAKTAPTLLTDLPPYPFDHSKTYWHESRLSRAYRQRRCLPHELLGVPTSDSNSIEPKWRRYLRLEEVAWLRGHVVQGQVVFPGAGYIAMGVEAIQQSVLSINPAARFEQIAFRNICLGQALVLSDDRKNVELTLSLRPETQSARTSSKTWQELRIFSVTDNNNWTEHCRALVSVELATDHKPDEGFQTASYSETSRAQLPKNAKKLKAEKFYYTSKQLGLDWSSPFDNLVSIERTSTCSLATIRSPSVMSSPTETERNAYWIHPAVLDSCLFHGLYGILMEEDGFRATVVPTFIKQLVISGQSVDPSVTDLTCYSQRTSAGLAFDVEVFRNELTDTKPIISASGVRATRISDMRPLAQSERGICHTLSWVAHMDYASKDYIKRQCGSIIGRGSILEKNRQLDSLAASHIRCALSELSVEEIPDGYRKLWFSWMQETMSTFNAVDISKDTLCEDGDPAFAAISRFGPNLTSLLKGTVQPISLLLEDNLLGRIYSEERCRRCYAQIAAYCAEYGRQRPQMRVLEIGAGSASASLPILTALRSSGRVMASQYVFTDISAGFFDAAKDVLADFDDTVSYQVLNIEDDPTTQGFEAGSYDIIIASNVIHATRSISSAISNAASLLRPSGKLILMEITQDRLFYNFIFGAFEGWWAGSEEGRTSSPLLSADQWSAKLVQNDFDNVTPVFEDYTFSEGGSISVFVANTKRPPKVQDGPRIHVFASSTTEPKSAHTVQGLQLLLGDQMVNLCELSASCTERKASILLPDICDRLGVSLPGEDWYNIQRHIISSDVVLFISSAMDEKTRSSGSLVKGLCRCLRMELPETRFITLELASPAQDVASMAEVLATLVQSPSFDLSIAQDKIETDFFWNGEQLFVSRVLPQPNMSNHIYGTLGLLPPKLAPFLDPKSSLIAETAIPGLVETIRWKHDPYRPDVGPDDVKFQLCAASINFKDVLIASGQLEGITEMQNDCSGIVVEVGSNMAGRFKVGDRICALYSRSYTNWPIVHGDCCHHIPEHMTFEDAASVPIVWITVYHSIVDLGRLQRGESILIHSAAGAVGQAAIMLARHIGAEIFVTAGTEAKKRTLMERYGIPADHIFSSRTVAFRDQIMKHTNGKGIDVVLNFLSGDMFRASCNVVATFGRFVEIGRKDLMNDALMPMEFLLKNVSFAYADLALVITENKLLAKRLLHEVFKLLSANAITTVPVQTMPINEIETAFRTLQASKHTGKLVLTVRADQKVNIVPPSPAAAALQSSATYLVIGGLGGLGRRVCTWLADRGAKNIVVASRSIESSDSGHSMVEALRHRGVSVILKSCDVCSEEQVQGLVADIRFPIRGVIQAAMVLQDALFEDMEVEKWFAAIDPKVTGSWNLHHHLPKDLDFFVMLSSIVAVSGNLGQSNYAAGCSFQDGLARYRTSLGLPAHSINVGVVAEDGFVSENPAVAASLKKRGFDTVAVREFLAHLDYVVTNPLGPEPSLSQSSIGLAPASNDAGSGQPTWTAGLTFAHFYEKESSHAVRPGATTDVLSTISPAMKVEEVVGVFSTVILKQLSKLIDIAFENLSAARSLDSYGVDSLVAVELRNWIGAYLQANVSLLALRSTESITELAELVTRESRMTWRKKENGDV